MDFSKRKDPLGVWLERRGRRGEKREVEIFSIDSGEEEKDAGGNDWGRRQNKTQQSDDDENACKRTHKTKQIESRYRSRFLPR